jgi:hypothetical protein
MDDPNNTTGILVEADEDILTSTFSDEAIEAAADIGSFAVRHAGHTVAPRSGVPMDVLPVRNADSA